MSIRLFRVAAWVVPRLPLRVAYGLAVLIADLLWRLSAEAREGIEHNLRRVLGGDAPQERLAEYSRAALRNLAKVYVDEFRVPTLSARVLRESVSIRGLEHLERALAGGRGVVICSLHYGAPQLVGQLLASFGHPVTAVVERLDNDEVFRFMLALRSSHGLRLLPTDQSMLPLMRTLRRENGIVPLAVDRNVAGGGVCAPFFGEMARVPDGALRLALRARAPIIVGWCRRLHETGRYEATLVPFNDLPDSGEDIEEAVRLGMTRILSLLETPIREDPGQWILTTPLWQHRCRNE